MQQQNNGDMRSIWSYILSQIRDHGLVFLMMAAVIWYMEGEKRNLLKKVDACNSDVITIYQSQNERLIETVERNSEAMENITRFLQNSNRQ